MSDRTGRPRRLLGDIASWMAAPIAEKLDRSAGWDRLPPRLALLTLLGLRHRLRERNLYDTRRGQPPVVPGEYSAVRTLDGTGNDLTDDAMGAVGTPFGRNGPPVVEAEDGMLYSPHPLEVSERLLTRPKGQFFPAETLNLLAAAWVQFEVHDWFSHRTERGYSEYGDRAGRPEDDGIPLEPRPLSIASVEEGVDEGYPAFLSDQTHWWDASQLYGANVEFATAMREFDGGRVWVDAPLLEAMKDFTFRSGGTGGAAVPNLWIGSALFHILFAKEHNAICERLHAEHPTWDDEDLYQKARLINAAVMAKIHTLEWTPAIIDHPAAVAGVRGTWLGLLPKEHRWWVPFADADEVLTGIPGSRGGHDSAPYALTEEFVAVYRMHQLIPDSVAFRRVADDSVIKTFEFADLAVARDEHQRPADALDAVEGHANAFYSLGVANPGAITLHNYPAFLQNFAPPEDPGILNLGQVDILRTRQTGVPRYNNFRRMFRLAPASSFHDIAGGNPKWAQEIRDVYSGELEHVDLLIGMFAERKPRGFAFSDTAFRVFILMAARRMRSDRFFTTDYTPDVYTSTGLDWINDATLTAILQRHYPELSDALSKVENPFRPWN